MEKLGDMIALPVRGDGDYIVNADGDPILTVHYSRRDDLLTTPIAAAINDIDALRASNEALREALRLIANINNGPDRASGEWRSGEADSIAERALKLAGSAL